MVVAFHALEHAVQALATDHQVLGQLIERDALFVSAAGQGTEYRPLHGADAHLVLYLPLQGVPRLKQAEEQSVRYTLWFVIGHFNSLLIR
ncbi:hypothetical protein D3C86_2022530 [compost metagenome]